MDYEIVAFNNPKIILLYIHIIWCMCYISVIAAVSMVHTCVHHTKADLEMLKALCQARLLH